MENKQLMSLLSKKIADELDWSSRVDECSKYEMVEEAITMFTKIMEKSIMNIVEK